MTQKKQSNPIDQIEIKQYQKATTTPKGKARFPALTAPDTAFSADGEYHVGLIVDPNDPEVSEWLDTIKEYADSLYNEIYNVLSQKNKKSAYVHYPWEDEYDDNDEPTGNVIVKFRSKAVAKKKDGTKFSLKPELVDARKNPWPKNTPIGMGSVIRIQTKFHPYYMPSTGMTGIKLRLMAVQVIKNQRFSAASAFDDMSDDEDAELPDDEDASGEDDDSDFDNGNDDDDNTDDIPF